MLMERFDAMKPGLKIAKLREMKGLSQKDLAIAAKIYPANLSEIEAGKVQARTKTLYKIAEVLGVKVEEITGESPLKPHDHLNLPDSKLNRHVAVIDARLDEIETDNLLIKQLLTQHQQKTNEEDELISLLRQYDLTKGLLSLLKLDPNILKATVDQVGALTLPAKQTSASEEGSRSLPSKKKPASS